MSANVYADERRAEAYANLEFPGTYYLAFRDLPAIIRAGLPQLPTAGGNALDFGCGTGRSTRFLAGLGFRVVGIDIAESMVKHARRRDPRGEYLVVPDADLDVLSERRFDLILSAFTFDNIPGDSRKGMLFRELGRLLTEGGIIVNLVSTPEIYINEWLSFSTRAFPANVRATSGDRVRIIMLDVDDQRPVEDILYTDAAYRFVYKQAGLTVRELFRPLGQADDPWVWKSETTVPPWSIYVLDRSVEDSADAA